MTTCLWSSTHLAVDTAFDSPLNTKSSQPRWRKKEVRTLLQQLTWMLMVKQSAVGSISKATLLYTFTSKATNLNTAVQGLLKQLSISFKVLRNQDFRLQHPSMKLSSRLSFSTMSQTIAPYTLFLLFSVNTLSTTSRTTLENSEPISKQRKGTTLRARRSLTWYWSGYKK